MFCERVNGDDPRWHNDHAIAFPDAYPLSPGHTLVVPREHQADMFALDTEARSALRALVDLVHADLATELSPDGFNIGVNIGAAAGQTVGHAHIHVIPHFGGDVPDPRGGVRWVLPDGAAYWLRRDSGLAPRVLEAHDAPAESASSGEPFVTPLAPLPGQSNMADVEPPTPIQWEEIEEMLQAAWERVRGEPGLAAYSPENEHIERTLVFRLGVHLDCLIAEKSRAWAPPWNEVMVDSELHRAYNGQKLDGTQAPDLIVHVRATGKWNLLAIEAKHNSKPSATDIEKLERLRVARHYRFVYAVSLDLGRALTITPVNPNGVSQPSRSQD